MTSMLERSILMTIGAAALTKDVADAITNEFVLKGREITGEGREAVDDLVGRAREEAGAVKGKLDDSLKRTFHDLGLATSEHVEELELKVAQLEHRLSLLEGGKAGPAVEAEPEPVGKEESGDEGEQEEEPVTEG